VDQVAVAVALVHKELLELHIMYKGEKSDI
jgi:hypothetical protein